MRSQSRSSGCRRLATSQPTRQSEGVKTWRRGSAPRRNQPLFLFPARFVRVTAGTSSQAMLPRNRTASGTAPEAEGERRRGKGGAQVNHGRETPGFPPVNPPFLKRMHAALGPTPACRNAGSSWDTGADPPEHAPSGTPACRHETQRCVRLAHEPAAGASALAAGRTAAPPLCPSLQLGAKRRAWGGVNARDRPVTLRQARLLAAAS